MMVPWRKAEYIFRPSQVGRRLSRVFKSPLPKFAEERLPWGLNLRYQPGESIGASIWRMGVYDLPVTEAIWQLSGPGETAIDAGANIGYMTSVMAARVGAKGRVIAFEPHPELFSELATNIRSWRDTMGDEAVVAHRVALSNEAGRANLVTAPEFANNRGTASLGVAVDGQNSFEVLTKTLTEVVEFCGPIGLMKIDVEGHELPVLQGASTLLSQHRIRDIIFEEHRAWPSPVTDYLAGHGYEILTLHRAISGLHVYPAGLHEAGHSFDACSFLATVAPARAVQRLSRKGWHALRALA